MPKECKRCGKGSQMQTTRKLLRGHYNPTSRKRKYPNLQWAPTTEGSRERVCTQCLRTAAKTPR